MINLTKTLLSAAHVCWWAARCLLARSQKVSRMFANRSQFGGNLIKNCGSLLTTLRKQFEDTVRRYVRKGWVFYVPLASLQHFQTQSLQSRASPANGEYLILHQPIVAKPFLYVLFQCSFVVVLLTKLLHDPSWLAVVSEELNHRKCCVTLAPSQFKVGHLRNVVTSHESVTRNHFTLLAVAQFPQRFCGTRNNIILYVSSTNR